MVQKKHPPSGMQDVNRRRLAKYTNYAGLAKPADAEVSNTSGEILTGSNPVSCTR